MRTIALILTAVLVCSTLAAAATYENSSVVGQVPGRIMVTFPVGMKLHVDKSGDSPRTGVAALDALTAKHGVTHLEPLYGSMIDMFEDPAVRADLARVYTVDFDVKSDLQAVLSDYAKSGVTEEVHAVDICKQFGTAYTPNDLASSQYFLRNDVIGGKDIRAVGGWAETLGDSTIIVAIGDSGIDWNHPDLGGPHPDKVNGSIWTNWAEYEGTPGVDDDSNGYIDDIRGWDFVDVPGDGWPDEDDSVPDNDPSDYESHGTNCAGCVAPITNNGIGIAGTAPGVKIMALRVGWLPNGETQGVVRMDFAASSMVYAAANGARIFNASWGSSSSLLSAVRTCLGAGMLIFTAAGNDNNDDASYLAAYNDPRVLAVAATTPNDTKASFSSFGSWVELSAPGTQIYTTAYNHTTGASTYDTTQGTSFSSPIAAGSAALIWSSDPTMTPYQVAASLNNGCDSLDEINPGYVGLLGSGRVNLLKSLGDNVQEVPGEFLAIQDALNMAAPADTIKVHADIELPTVTIQGKGLQIYGGYADGYVDRDAAGTPTVVEGNPNNPALQFSGAVDQTTVIDGFQVQGGGGRFYADIPYPGNYGGGIMCNGVSPTLRNLIVTGNTVGSNSVLGLGGGIALSNSEAVLENITVTGNTAMYGGGIFIYAGSPTLDTVTITANTVVYDNLSYPPLGGGLHVVDTDVTLTDVVVSDHADAIRGGGIYAGVSAGATVVTMTGGAVSGNTAKTYGGGICAEGVALELTGVEITGNTPTADSNFLSGGGLYIDAGTVAVDSLVVTGNTAHSGSSFQFSTCTDVQVRNTVVTGNTGLLFAGNIFTSSCTAAVFENLTVADNSCVNGGAGFYISSTPVTISNSISAYNTGGTGSANGMFFSNSAATLACNDVYGNDGDAYGGVDDPTGTGGNIAVDPLFCDRPGGDYRVASSSPCAPDQSGGCGLIGALEATCGTLDAVEDPDTPVAFRVDNPFPNPFNPATTIRFAVPEGGRTSVVIYDVQGRRVRTLVDADLPAATHTVQWRGRDDGGRSVSAGIYFYRVDSGRHTAVGRMALIK